MVESEKKQLYRQLATACKTKSTLTILQSRDPKRDYLLRSRDEKILTIRLKSFANTTAPAPPNHFFLSGLIVVISSFWLLFGLSLGLSSSFPPLPFPTPFAAATCIMPVTTPPSPPPAAPPSSSSESSQRLSFINGSHSIEEFALYAVWHAKILACGPCSPNHVCFLDPPLDGRSLTFSHDHVCFLDLPRGLGP